MRKSIQKKDQRPETLFERMCREERNKLLNRSDVLFFGLTIMLGLLATQNVLFI